MTHCDKQVTEKLYMALSNLVTVANVDEIDPLAMFVCIEQARAVLELAEKEGM